MSLKTGERQRLFLPTVTSQYPICPIPFRVDSYNGCPFHCSYCLASYFTKYSRRNNPDPAKRSSTYLEMNDPKQFKVWLDRVIQTNKYNYNRGAEVAILERIPVKFGGTADPFPPVEMKHQVTYQMLQALHEHDYPVQILTKNPSLLSRYSADFDNPNWVISVTIISMDERFVKTAEPGAPPPRVRLKAIEKLVSQNQNVMCKIQPAIYPKIVKDLPDLIKALKDSGCWAFAIEGLKVRISMYKDEQEKFERIGQYSGDDEFLGMGIRKYYRLRGVKSASDMEIARERKLEYINSALELADKYKIKGFVADNHMGKLGAGCECCGTERLRNYKIWGLNHRTRAFGKFEHESEHMKKVVINTFSYSSDPRRYRTLGEVMNEELKPKGRLL